MRRIQTWVLLLLAAVACIGFNHWPTIRAFARLWWKSWHRNDLSAAEIAFLRSKSPPGTPDADLLLGEKYEVTHVNGIKFKIYTRSDGQKLYLGPPGAVLMKTVDGTPISAYIDQAQADREAVQHKLFMEKHQREDEQRRKAGRH